MFSNGIPLWGHLNGMHKNTVGIVCGGFTSEAAISKKSGQTVFESLSRELWTVFLIVIQHEHWIAIDDENNEYPFSKGNFTLEKEGIKIQINVVFNAVHGAPGEDGQLAALLDLLNIPQTGCNHYSTALTWNKRDCLSVLRPHGIPTADSFHLDKDMPIDENAIIEKVGLPCFVKANRAGSSFGVYKVTQKKTLRSAIHRAWEEDDQLIIESFLDGREVSVGAVFWKNGLKILPVTEMITENDFFDYSAKYEGKSQEITPAVLESNMTSSVSNLTEKIYRTLGLSGVIRCDFIFVGTVPHLLEVNTIPGLTRESIIPQQLHVAGITLTEFFDTLLLDAMKNK